MTAIVHRCQHCGARLTWAKTGRPRLYCKTACRVAAYRARPEPLPLPPVVPVDHGSRQELPGAELRRDLGKKLYGFGGPAHLSTIELRALHECPDWLAQSPAGAMTLVLVELADRCSL